VKKLINFLMIALSLTFGPILAYFVNQPSGFDVTLFLKNPSNQPIELFYDLRESPLRSSDFTKKVSFSNVSTAMDKLRLDFGNQVGQEFSIIKIDLLDKETGTLTSLFPEDLSVHSQLFEARLTRTTLLYDFITTGPDSQLWIPIPSDLNRDWYLNSITTTLKQLTQNYNYFFSIIGLFLLIPPIITRFRTFLIFAITTCCLLFISPFLVSVHSPIRNISFGPDIFQGFDPALTSFLVILLILAALLAIFNYSRHNRIVNKSIPSEKIETTFHITGFDWLIALGVFCISSIPATVLNNSLGFASPIDNWDSSNIENWKILMARGFQPMRDFFYPYENLFLIDQYNPKTNLAYSLSLTLTVILFFGILNSKMDSFALKLVPILALLSFPGNILRYTFPLVVALAYWVLIRKKIFPYFFSFSFGLLLTLSITTALYVFISLFAVHAVFWISAGKSRQIRELRQFLTLAMIGFGLFLIIGSLQSNLRERIAFITLGQEVISQSANTVSGGFFHFSNFSFLWVALISAAFMALLFTGQFAKEDLALLSTGVIFWLLLVQKEFMRDMFPWLLAPTLVLSLVFFSRFISKHNIMNLRVIIPILTISLTITNFGPPIFQTFKYRLNGFSTYISSAGNLLSQNQANFFNESVGSLNFAIKRWPKEWTEFNSIPSEIIKTSTILSNNSAYSNFQNAITNRISWTSELWLLAISENQEKFIADSKEAKYLIIDKDFGSIDEISNHIRLAEISKWMRENFSASPILSTNSLLVLKRDSSTNPILLPELDFGQLLSNVVWRDNIGNVCPTISQKLNTPGLYAMYVQFHNHPRLILKFEIPNEGTYINFPLDSLLTENECGKFQSVMIIRR
jgi:hypothetical protein